MKNAAMFARAHLGRLFDPARKAGLGKLFVVALTLGSIGCAKEPEFVSLSATTFNYSQEYLIEVSVGGKSAGSIVKPAVLGEVRGGGKVVCCISLSRTERMATVTIRAAKDEKSVDTYTTLAEVRQPWPQIASYAVVHVLPGRKVVVEVVPTAIQPDMELLEHRIKELGLERPTLRAQ